MTDHLNPFKHGQLVEFLKDFPTVGITKGSRLPVKTLAHGVPAEKNRGHAIRATCGFEGFLQVRFPIEFLKTVE